MCLYRFLKVAFNSRDTAHAAIMLNHNDLGPDSPGLR